MKIQADILIIMNSTKQRIQEQRQKITTVTQSKWFYILGIAAAAILLVSFIPGGGALRILLVPLFGWSSFILMLRRYGFRKLVRAVFAALAIMVLASLVLF